MMKSADMKNSGFIYIDRISRADEGLSVAAFYVRRYRHSDEAAWRLRIETGQIFRNEERAGAEDILMRGDVLSYHRPPWEELEVPLEFGVLFEDDDIVLLAKPSGLPVLPGGGFLENTLLNQARLRFGPLCSPLHRLGRGTSGAILFTRNAPTARVLVRAMEEKRILKVYLALASRAVKPDEFTIDAPIGPVPYLDKNTAAGAPGFTRGTNSAALDRVYDARTNVHAYSPHGRPSTSHVRVIRRFPQENASLLEVTIPTGRPHQIRIHLAFAGFPLAGDPLYLAGGMPRLTLTDDGRPALPGDLGYQLHSWKIRFPHPGLGREIEVISPPPPKLNPRGDTALMSGKLSR
jgi:23S rRNA pseudouridine1911/1915/1917 synthase